MFFQVRRWWGKYINFFSELLVYMKCREMPSNALYTIMKRACTLCHYYQSKSDASVSPSKPSSRRNVVQHWEGSSPRILGITVCCVYFIKPSNGNKAICLISRLYISCRCHLLHSSLQAIIHDAHLTWVCIHLHMLLTRQINTQLGILPTSLFLRQHISHLLCYIYISVVFHHEHCYTIASRSWKSNSLSSLLPLNRSLISMGIFYQV